MKPISHPPYFFTATILDWKPLLAKDVFKQIVLDSLSFLVKNERVFVYAFVIMDNHIHLIWQMRDPHQPKDVQRDFLKFTSQKMKFHLLDNDPEHLSKFEVNLADRKYQFWQRNPLSIEVDTAWIMEQKLDYIHQNPVKAGLYESPIHYRYSSARFYFTGKWEFTFLMHHEG